MKPLSPLDGAVYSELLDLCRIDSGRSSPFKPNGSFVEEARNGGQDRYWYYRGYERTLDGSPGKATKSFVGRVGDAHIEATVAAHAEMKASYTTRRQIVARLKRAGLPAPNRMEAAVLQVLAEMGLLSSGVTVVGSAAFQTYGGLLGMRFDQSQYRTLDLDLAQPRGLEVHLDGAGAQDLLEALRQVDGTFAPLFHADEPRLIVGFRNAQQFRIEFLTPRPAQRGSGGGFAKLAGLPGVGAQALKFLEFSLKDTISAVVLHEAGLLVPVPDPARFAVHKLIVAAIRGDEGAEHSSKSLKDIMQAQGLIEGFAHVRETMRLGRAWLEAWTSGPNWRKAVREGSLRLSGQHLSIVAAAATEAAGMDGLSSPFEADADPRKALTSRPGAPRAGV